MSVWGATSRTILKELNTSPKEKRSRSGPPKRPADTQEPDRKAVSNPALAASLAVNPSQTAGITMNSGADNNARRRSGGVMGVSSKFSVWSKKALGQHGPAISMNG